MSIAAEARKCPVWEVCAVKWPSQRDEEQGGEPVLIGPPVVVVAATRDLAIAKASQGWPMEGSVAVYARPFC